MIDFLKSFYSQVQKNPGRAAVVDRGGERRTSYAELAEVSARLATWLLKQGIGREKLVAIRVPRGLDFIACRIAAMMVGGAWVGVEEMMGAERIEYIIKDSGAVLTIDEEAYGEGMKEEPLKPEQWADPDPHDMAFIFYTSGSTGKPKGAVQEYGIYRYIMDSTHRAIDRWDFLDYANVAPETYIGGIDLMIGILQAGSTLHIIPLGLVRDPAGLLRYFKEQHVAASCMPPTLIKVLESIGGLDLKVLHVAGEIATDLYIDRFPVRNAYGPTEIAYLPFFFDIDRPYSVTPIGTPDKNTEVILINENGEKDDKEGMLCIHLPYFRGYLHDRERAELITIDGKPYFKTGDCTSLDPAGNYTILGRMDDMVKINGNRIEPSEVESAIKKVLGTDFAAVKAWERGGSQYLCAYHNCGRELNAAEMAEKLKDYLPLYMIPSCYISLEEIPLNENGKVDKKVLPRPDESALFAPYAPPENELQRRLCAAFADALKIDRERLGIDDDFFLLGGDSLAAVRVITQVEHSALTVVMIYRERTVRGIDRALQSIKEAAEDDPVGKEFPLSNQQLFFAERETERPGRSIFNQPLMLSFSPDTDEHKLAEAVRSVFFSHPALLTVIRKEGENWIQQIVLENNTGLTVTPISEEELKEEKLIRPFFLDGTPLFRRRLYRTDKRVALFLDFHHIICDGHSLRIVAEDIMEAYRGSEIPGDAWTEIIGRSTVYGKAQREEDRKYFELGYGDKYDGDRYDQIPVFDQMEEGHRGEEEIYPFAFRKEEILQAAKRMKLSVNAFYILVTSLSLMAYNNVENVVFVWTFNGRSEIKAIRTVGLLLRDFPVALSLDKADTVDDAASSINRQIREAIMHGSITPFIDIKRGEMLDFLYQGDLLEIPDYKELIGIDTPGTQDETAIEPIELQVYEDEKGSRLQILYDAGLYRRESMDRFAMLFESVCSLLLKDTSGDMHTRDIVREVSG